MSDSFVRLDPIRMLFHIQPDKNWTKVTPKTLLQADEKDDFSWRETTKGSEARDDLELTAQRLIQEIDKGPPNQGRKGWKDRGLQRVLKLVGKIDGLDDF